MHICSSTGGRETETDQYQFKPQPPDPNNSNVTLAAFHSPLQSRTPSTCAHLSDVTSQTKAAIKRVVSYDRM